MQPFHVTCICCNKSMHYAEAIFVAEGIAPNEPLCRKCEDTTLSALSRITAQGEGGAS